MQEDALAQRTILNDISLFSFHTSEFWIKYRFFYISVLFTLLFPGIVHRMYYAESLESVFNECALYGYPL